MIDWGAFLVVAASSLIGACVVVTVAALGIRFYERSTQTGTHPPALLKSYRLGANLLFALSGLIAIFGVYLIVPFFH